jgi:hypothetical protein
MAYQYDLDAHDRGDWKPCLLPCDNCGYPEPRDLGPILVLDWDGHMEAGVVWLSGFRLLACPCCELTSYGKLPS